MTVGGSNEMVMQWNLANVTKGCDLAERFGGHGAFTDERTGDVFVLGGMKTDAE
jgi:hypothetical protein